MPFEKKIYDHFKIPCLFVGHTTADTMPLEPDKNMIRSLLGISHHVKCMAILPGSRSSEIEMLSAIFLKTACIIYSFYPNIEILVPMVREDLRKRFEHIKSVVAPNLRVHLLNGKSQEAMMASDVTLLASGTATLECMLAKCPMVVGYRVKSLTFWVAKLLLKTKYISLPNLLANSELVQELLQNKCQPQALASALLLLLDNNKIRHQVRDNFRKLHQQIRCNADHQAAEAVLKILKR